MITAAVGLFVGIVIGAGCRFFDIPSPAPPRLIGAFLLLAMTLGFLAAGQLLPTSKVTSQTAAGGQMVAQ